MIVLDVGNGSIKWGRFSDGDLAETGRAPLDSDLGFLPDAPDRAVSVNPPVTARLKAAIPALRVVGEDLPLPVPQGYETCGHDRVCALAGALREADAAIVLDAGTCLVATAGTRADGVLGGAIAPGPDLMSAALSEGTAALPAVPYAGAAPGLGNSTPASIRAGIDAAHIGAARELIARIRAELAIPLLVVATGTGGAELSARVPEIDEYRAYLPLWGAFFADPDKSDSAHPPENAL